MKNLEAHEGNYWERILPKLLVLVSAGIVIGAYIILQTLKETKAKSKFTHTHFINENGKFIYSDAMVSDNHSCDLKYIEVVCRVPSKERIEEVFNDPEVLAATAALGRTGPVKVPDTV